jgi:hypothetical protein
MRRILIAVLFGAVMAALPTAAQAQSAQAQAVVSGWYNRFLHRAFEPAGLGFAAALDQGQSPDKILSGILGSDEYYLRSGSTPQGYVQNLFTDLNGRQPSPQEYGFWVNRLVQVGGAAPDFEQRTDVAYEMLTRYPQNWQFAAPVTVAPYVAPTVVVPPIINYGRRYGDHDDYEYRRPFVPSVRVERDHREDHDRRNQRDHHDDRDHKRK